MIRALALSVALLGLTACSTLATLHGAKPLPKGKKEFVLATSLQTGSNSFSYVGFPIPQLEFGGRWGVAEDVDVGFRAWLLGAGFDTRYRFWHDDRRHLAIAPAIGGFYLPTVGGTVEMHAPVLGQVDLAPWANVSGGPRVVMRNQINPVRMPDGQKGRVARIDVFAGAGGRLELALGRRAWFGLSGDVFAQPARHAAPGWSVGIDLAFRRREDPAP